MSSTFMHPYFLLLLLVLPIAVFWYYKTNRKHQIAVKMSTIQGLEVQKSWLVKFRPILFVLQLLALTCLIVALARPRNTQKSTYTDATKGVEIVIATDVSASMLATDLSPNRLEAIKEVAKNFVKNRNNDRIGVVVYAGESYTKTPITSDKNMIIKAINEIEYNGYLLQDGTSIGTGLATSINRIKNSKAKSKVIILLTDGVNNVGSLDPISASEIAKAYNIKVYTIGVGTNGMANFPVSKDFNGNIIYQQQKVEIDESLMKEIAKITGGKYFRATDNKKLEAIYDEINTLEKSKITENKFMMFDEQFRGWVLLALLFFAGEFIFRKTLYKSFI